MNERQTGQDLATGAPLTDDPEPETDDHEAQSPAGATVAEPVAPESDDSENPDTGTRDESGGSGDPFAVTGADDHDGSDPDGTGARPFIVQRWVSWLIVAACMIFVFWSLHPQLIFDNTTPTGGDMGAHVWGPQYLADSLIPDFRLTGWTQDWYAGFPAYVFYMVVPSLFIVWLNAGPPVWLGVILMAALAAGVRWARPRLTERWARQLMWLGVVVVGVLLVPIPYNIAFKLVAVSGLVTLPLAAYALGRAARVSFPGPPLLAVATLPFIYDRSFTILGGNGASTMAGEFAFSISLTFALLYLAVAFRGTRTGRDRALGAALLALTILCHLIPAIFAGVATLVLLVVRREDRIPWWDRSRAGRAVATVLVLATLLTLMPSIELPFGLVLSSPFPQWWFPALGTAVALVLMTGFEPRFVRWWWDNPIGRIVAAVLVLAAATLLLTRSGWWTLTIVVIALGIAFFSGWDDRLARWLILVGPIGIVATAFWSLPFLLNSTYMNDMGWEKYTDYQAYLLSDPSIDSGGMPYRNVVFALAGLGILLSLIHRVRLGWFLTLTVVTFAWTFRYFPQYRLWNARLLPFHYLCLYLLAGLAVALTLRSISLALADYRRRRPESVAIGAGGALAATVVVGVVMMGSFGMLPGSTPVEDPGPPARSYFRFLGVDFVRGIVPDWARWNFEGLEGKPAYQEFAGIVDMMDRVSDEHGCGRAMWEYESDLQRFGTPMALMLLPYFTDGCVGSMEGLYFEASSTTPFHFLNQSALSTQPSRAQRDLPYTGFDIDLGVSQLQMLGVKYYMATSEPAIDAARQHPDLEEVAAERFAAPGGDTAVTQHEWVVFEVAGSDLVAGLPNLPVVAEDADDHIDGWVYGSSHPPAEEGQPRPPKPPGPAVNWFQNPSRWDVHLATSGPDEWPRVPTGDSPPPAEPQPEVTVSNITTTNDSVSFEVDRTDVPVLVRTSYFPNWGVDGAEGPWRVSPNFMVVIPTEEQVTLRYGYSAYDILGWLLTFAALGGIVLLGVADVRAGRREDEMATVGAAPTEPPGPAGDPDDGDTSPEVASPGAVTGGATSAEASTAVAVEDDEEVERDEVVRVTPDDEATGESPPEGTAPDDP
jgi:hypothetical protein